MVDMMPLGPPSGAAIVDSTGRSKPSNVVPRCRPFASVVFTAASVRQGLRPKGEARIRSFEPPALHGWRLDCESEFPIVATKIPLGDALASVAQSFVDEWVAWILVENDDFVIARNLLSAVHREDSLDERLWGHRHRW